MQCAHTYSLSHSLAHTYTQSKKEKKKGKSPTNVCFCRLIENQYQIPHFWNASERHYNLTLKLKFTSICERKTI